jgi:prephenate dehydratase
MAIDKIYILGPEGTFSDHAARRLNDHLVQTGERAAELCYTRSIPEALELASRDERSRAVAPIENSETGTVVATQDHLAKFGLFIEWEMNVKIRMTFIADAPLAEVSRVYAHPVAQGQCDVFMGKQLPTVEVDSTRSNVDSGIRWTAASPAEKSAAIVPWDYTPGRAPAFTIPDVQNDAQNTTRFVVVRGGPDKTGDFSRAKTSLLIEPDADRPGLLFEILSVFGKHGINLCRIESRPPPPPPLAGRWNVVLLGTFDALP